MDKNEIAEWLDAIGKDRDWLASQCGTKKRTIDSWFSTRGFPPWAAKMIENLQRSTAPQSTGNFKVSFSAEEFERIEEARLVTGHTNRPAFYHDAIVDFADRIIEREQVTGPHRLNETPPQPWGRTEKRANPSH